MSERKSFLTRARRFSTPAEIPVENGDAPLFINNDMKSPTVRKRPLFDRTSAYDYDEAGLEGPLLVTTAAGLPGTYAYKREPRHSIDERMRAMSNSELSQRLRELQRRVDNIDRALVIIALAVVSVLPIMAVLA